MIGSFKKSFKQNKKINPPREVILAMEKDIPSNFMLQYDEKTGLILIPKGGETISGSITYSDETLDMLKDVPKDKWLTYLYRTQRAVSVKNVIVGDDDNKVPLALVGQNPLHDINLLNVVMYPNPFPEPFDMTIDTKDGDHIELKMKQVAYDSWLESKFENINQKGIKIELYIHDEDINKSRITYNVSPQKAETVDDALRIVHIFTGLIEGTAKINGQKALPNRANSEIDINQLQDMTRFWEDALKIEKKLGVKFIPSADYPEEDTKFFAELAACFIHRKSILWKHPFDSFHVGGVSSREVMEETIGKPGLKYSFIEGPIPCTLLGSEFELYIYCELKDFQVKSINWDKDGNGAELYIDDMQDKAWTMIRFYLTNEERLRIEELMKDKKAISLPGDIDGK